MSDEVVVERASWSIAPYFIVNDVRDDCGIIIADMLGFRYETLWNERRLLHGPSKWHCYHAGSFQKRSYRKPSMSR